LNATLTEQLPDVGKVAEQELVIGKSFGFAPPILTLLIVMVDFVPFVSMAD
jgi:hypothetical protein